MKCNAVFGQMYNTSNVFSHSEHLRIHWYVQKYLYSLDNNAPFVHSSHWYGEINRCFPSAFSGYSGHRTEPKNTANFFHTTKFKSKETYLLTPHFHDVQGRWPQMALFGMLGSFVKQYTLLTYNQIVNDTAFQVTHTDWIINNNISPRYLYAVGFILPIHRTFLKQM